MSDEPDLEEYTQFLKGLRLRYFSPSEITNYAKSTRNGVRNALPPEDLWDNLPPTLWVLDAFRHYIQKPVRLTSIYRSPSYNKSIGSGAATRSQHLRNCAVDFQVEGMSPHAAFNQLIRMRKAGCFVGGCGTYSTFTHVDTRGVNATW